MYDDGCAAAYYKKIMHYEKIKYYLKQLLPLHYCTVVRRDGVTHYIQWRMWFGQTFNVDKREV